MAIISGKIQVYTALTVCIALCACQTNNRLDSTQIGLKAPAGTERITESVDGLIVGHRLMAAGEYELALKAYNRAASEQGINVDILSAMGSANLKLTRLGQAEKLLRAAVNQDEKFVPAWNNLGIVLMSKGNIKEAERVFRLAFALDSGRSDQIKANLTLAIAKIEKKDYNKIQETKEFELVRRGNGRFLLLQTPNSDI